MSEREVYKPGNAYPARALVEGEIWTLVHTRELRHSPQRVWAALTEPEQLRQWSPFDASANLGHEGASVKLTTVGAPTPMVSEERITRAEAPSILEYTWGGRRMRWELEATESGTRLTLLANIDRAFIAMGASGWHVCLDVLDRLLGGTPIGRIVGRDALQLEGWVQLNADYARILGVVAEK